MKEKKIYLSLDDLHKLYGIAPDIILKRKKKSKKKKAKSKKKSNFGTGVNKQFGGGGIGGVSGVGSVNSSTIDRREIDILRGQLNEAKNNPNRPENAGVLRLENVPEELKETLKFAKLANDGYASGNVKISKSSAGNLIIGPTSQKQKQEKRRKAFDISSKVDHTINEAPPLKTSNDLVHTQPLEFKTNDQVEELSEEEEEDIPLEPVNKLAEKPKEAKKQRTKAQIQATEELQKHRAKNKIASDHHRRQTLKSAFESIREEAQGNQLQQQHEIHEQMLKRRPPPKTPRKSKADDSDITPMRPVKIEPKPKDYSKTTFPWTLKEDDFKDDDSEEDKFV